MGLTIYYYGQRFLDEGIDSCIINLGYYFVTFGVYVSCSIFTVMMYELIKRQDFYRQYQEEQESKEWQKLLSDLPEPIIFMKEKNAIFYNDATVKLLELDSFYIDNCSNMILDEISWLKEKNSKKPLNEYLQDLEPGINDTSLYTGWKNGKKKWINIKRITCKEEYEEEGIVEYIFHDITAIKTLERDKYKEKCFDILLATTSHDIRTPLNLILGVVEVLADFVKTPVGIEQIDIARCCGQRMLVYLKGLEFLRQINLGSLN